MTKSKRVKYEGRLAEPIPFDVEKAKTKGNYSDEIWYTLNLKYMELGMFLGVDNDDPMRDRKIAMKLAFHHVPGFRLLMPSNAGRKKEPLNGKYRLCMDVKNEKERIASSGNSGRKSARDIPDSEALTSLAKRNPKAWEGNKGQPMSAASRQDKLIRARKALADWEDGLCLPRGSFKPIAAHGGTLAGLLASVDGEISPKDSYLHLSPKETLALHRHNLGIRRAQIKKYQDNIDILVSDDWTREDIQGFISREEANLEGFERWIEAAEKKLA